MPTIVLVHGAFAESASWNGVIRRLHTAGHRVIAAGNPLRTLSSDAAAVADLPTRPAATATSRPSSTSQASPRTRARTSPI
jgi:pimeloyl-ACP methyl ester carboxylesterase